MPRFSYKDGCVLCNQCGKLHDPTPQQGTEKFECPCGNADTLDAIERLVELYNPGHDSTDGKVVSSE
jgi:hypothetical protein